MNFKIGLWMLAGLAIAGCWGAVAAFIPHTYNPGHFWTIVEVSAPASLLGRRMPLGMLSFILLNGAIYALVGAAIELIRWNFSQHHWKRTSA